MVPRWKKHETYNVISQIMSHEQIYEHRQGLFFNMMHCMGEFCTTALATLS